MQDNIIGGVNHIWINNLATLIEFIIGQTPFDYFGVPIYKITIPLYKIDEETLIEKNSNS